MDLKTIELFLKAAATENLSKAAAQSGYSQSAVTVQIQKLEKELGVQLFERIGKRIYLTDRGAAFIPYANEILKAGYAALAFSGEEEQLSGVLRIGGVESVCTALLPELLSSFYRQYPAVSVVIRSGPTKDLLELAGSNELDLVFTLDEKLCRPDLICAAEQKEEIIFVTQTERGRRLNPPIAARRLCREPMLLTETGAAYRYELERLLAERNVTIQPILEIGNTETIIKLLTRGMGISFLPRFTVAAQLEQRQLVELPTDLPQVNMHHQLLYHKGKWVTRPMEAFIALVRSRLGKPECLQQL